MSDGALAGAQGTRRPASAAETGRAGGRLERRFAMLRERNEAAFVPFIMCGDRGLDTTAMLVDELVEAGADILELGIPFSDPMADGPVLQRAAERAIRAGSTIPRILELVVELRRRSDVPVVLFGYANPFFHFGPERFAEAAAAAGVDAVLCVDTPPDEADELRLPLERHGLHMIFLLAPTSTPERIRRVLRVAGGFVYFVSVTGVTGVKTADAGSIEDLVGRIRKQSKVPVGVGFGISTPEQARELASFSDAVIVGTHLARIVEEAPDAATAVRRVGEAARELKAATRRWGRQ